MIPMDPPLDGSAVPADAPAEPDEDYGDGDGCDCTELCEMGPTCPGGSLAGLPGSGCYRAQPDWTPERIALLRAALTSEQRAEGGA